MSFNTKAVALSVAGLLAVAGGLYAFMPPGQDGAASNGKAAASVQSVAIADAPNPVASKDKQSGTEATAQGSDAAAAPKQSSQDQTATQAPKKLTRAQLTPPPATENEKLEKAAEQESNF